MLELTFLFPVLNKFFIVCSIPLLHRQGAVFITTNTSMRALYFCFGGRLQTNALKEALAFYVLPCLHLSKNSSLVSLINMREPHQI